MKYVWDEHAWADYLWWQAQDRKVLKRINTLLQDVVRNGNEEGANASGSGRGFQV